MAPEQQTIGSAFDSAYAEVVRLARAKLAGSPAPISALTLVHEVYLRVQHRRDLHFGSKGEFLAYTSHAMRSVLVDMARERLAQKRSAEMLPLTLAADVVDHGSGTPEQMLALDQALAGLGKADARLMQVAEMRVMLGLEMAEIAQALNLSEQTIKRDWKRAKAYLNDALAGAGS